MFAAVKTQKSICAENLKALRKANDLSQAELAEQLGTDPVVISKWERGASSPNSKFVARLSEFFKVPYSHFVDDGIELKQSRLMPTIIDVMDVLDAYKNAPDETREEVLATLGIKK